MKMKTTPKPKLIAHRMSESEFPPDTWRYSLAFGSQPLPHLRPVFMRRLDSFYWFLDSSDHIEDVTNFGRPTPHVEVLKRWAREELEKRYAVVAHALACESAGQQRLF